MQPTHEFDSIVTKTFLRVLPEKVRNKLNAGDVINVKITVIKFSAEKGGEIDYGKDTIEGSDSEKNQGITDP